MAKKNPDLTQLRELRERRGLSQQQFWPLFGITQSGGSLYEGGQRPLPPSLALLLHFRHSGMLTDEDLIRAGKTLSERKARRNAQRRATLHSARLGADSSAAGNPGLNALRKVRLKLGLNQEGFWRRFGVTQSAGSRYELGQSLPGPLALLIVLWHSGKLTDENLHKAGKTLAWRRRKASPGGE